MTNRKRKKKHLKLMTIGGNAKVQFGSKNVVVTVTIPKDRLQLRIK